MVLDHLQNISIYAKINEHILKVNEYKERKKARRWNMNIDEWIKLSGVITAFIQIIVWPLTIFGIFLYLRDPLKNFLNKAGELTLKAGPLETTIKSQVVEATAALAAATTQKQDTGLLPLLEETPREVAEFVSQIVTLEAAEKLNGASILWVDDEPSNNTYERNALEALGVRFTICIDTREAMKQVRIRQFNLVLSDMGRGEDRQAGYKLLEQLREQDIITPFIIYARGGNKAENKIEAQSRGAFTSVAGPQKLFKAVVDAIESGKQEKLLVHQG